MAFTVKQFDLDTVLLQYTGLVDYRGRAVALTRAIERLRDAGVSRLLIDFSSAVIVEEGPAERADFIANAITAWTVSHVRVAFVAVPHAYAWPVELACEVRHIPTRAFRDRESAMEWLRQSPYAPDAASSG